MAYQLPLRFIRVSNKANSEFQSDVAICATRIVAMMSTESYQARETLKAERKAGTLINAAGRETAKTTIFLDNGSVIASPLSVKTLMNAIEKSNSKYITPTSNPVRMKVYDIMDEEPNEKYDIEVSDTDSIYTFEDLPDDERPEKEKKNTNWVTSEPTQKQIEYIEEMEKYIDDVFENGNKADAWRFINDHKAEYEEAKARKAIEDIDTYESEDQGIDPY